MDGVFAEQRDVGNKRAARKVRKKEKYRCEEEMKRGTGRATQTDGRRLGFIDSCVLSVFTLLH